METCQVWLTLGVRLNYLQFTLSEVTERRKKMSSDMKVLVHYFKTFFGASQGPFVTV